MSLEDLVLMPEVQARRILSAELVSFSVLAPVGVYAGRGVLRVLRVKPQPSTVSQPRIELVCGYEAYDRL